MACGQPSSDREKTRRGAEVATWWPTRVPQGAKNVLSRAPLHPSAQGHDAVGLPRRFAETTISECAGRTTSDEV